VLVALEIITDLPFGFSIKENYLSWRIVTVCASTWFAALDLPVHLFSLVSFIKGPQETRRPKTGQSYFSSLSNELIAVYLWWDQTMYAFLFDESVLNSLES